MANALLVRCKDCMGASSGQCIACELVEVKAERERFRQDNELLRHQLSQRTTEMASLWERLAAASAGISLRGWWCLTCSTFNGEEQGARSECRHCGLAKVRS